MCQLALPLAAAGFHEVEEIWDLIKLNHLRRNISEPSYDTHGERCECADHPAAKSNIRKSIPRWYESWHT